MMRFFLLTSELFHHCCKLLCIFMLFACTIGFIGGCGCGNGNKTTEERQRVRDIIAVLNEQEKEKNTASGTSREPVLPPAKALVASRATGSVRTYTRSVSVDQRSITTTVVAVPLGSYRVQVGLAGGKVGSVQSLGAIAVNHSAVAAINGCFFDAYSGKEIRNPYHLLLTGGRLAHRGTVGSVLGFCPDGFPYMDRVTVNIVGSLDGNETWPDNWYAYWLNRLPESETAAIIYDSHWVRSTTPNTGIQVVVAGGTVKKIGTGSQTIPRDGFVLLLSGKEKYMAERFAVGRRSAWRAVLKSHDETASWAHMREALGAGPRLVTQGRVEVQPSAEGFSDPKIISMSCNRSAVGVTDDGMLLLVTTGSATVRQLAQVMQSLGCQDAINLDGGASSGLWLEGRYLTQPGRNIANALVIRRL